MKPILTLDAVSVRRAGRLVLSDATLVVAPGEVVGVVGPNGAGKTSLLQAALGIAKLDGGVARLDGQDVSRLSDPRRAALAAYLPQERRVGWNLPAWRIASLGCLDRSPAEAREAARGALARVGLTALADRGVLDMSGGERARALLARLLVTGAPLMVADEPTVGLDPDAQFLTLDLFREEAARGAGVVLTLHDLTLAARACDRLVVLHAGRIAADGTPAQALTPAVLRDAFGLDGALEQTRAGPVLVAGRVVT
jgi:iron complex transport system ATP-binding protein